MLDPVPQGYISLDESVGPLTADISDQELAEEQQRLVPGLQAQQNPELPPYVVMLPGDQVEPDRRISRSRLSDKKPRIRVALLPTKRDLALTQLYIALRDGELVNLVRDPQTGQFFRLTGGDWFGAAFWRDMIVGGVVRASTGEEIYRHKGRRILLEAAAFDAWRRQRAQKRPQPAEVACAAWLEDLLRKNPERSPKTIPELRADAMDIYRVSARKFNEMLEKKSGELGIKWSRGRRPKAPSGN
jgi:hypothetical protein